MLLAGWHIKKPSEGIYINIFLQSIWEGPNPQFLSFLQLKLIPKDLFINN